MIMNALLLFGIFTVLVSCKGQKIKPIENKPEQSVFTSIGDTVSGLGKNIDCIFG